MEVTIKATPPVLLSKVIKIIYKIIIKYISF